MIYHLLIRPILSLLIALIGRERAERWVDNSFVPVWVTLGVITVAVTTWAVTS